jgi:ATP-dependent helicase/nuclease subunit A
LNGFLPYLCISASAGSGKTFRLSRRVLRLLAMGEAPDEIAAYTFSRKAAGEIFDSIVDALCHAAGSDQAAAQTSQDIGIAHSRQSYIDDLRSLLQALHRLRIGTLDSRISQMLSAVSVELGLPPDLTLMDSGSAEYLRLQSQVLNGLFRSGTLKPADADTFLQLFAEATYGKSEKNFTGLIEQFLEKHRATFLLYPDAKAWRGPEISEPPVALSSDEAEACVKHIRACLPGEVTQDKVRDSLQHFAEACAGFSLHSTWSKDLPSSGVGPKLLDGEGPCFSFSRKEYELSEALWASFEALIDHVFAVALAQVQRRTLALFGFLFVYESAYRGTVFPGGQLSFDDACLLMANFDQLQPAEMAYRLDGEISHWLLDEFQDTNQLQWQVLEPFLSEVMQDPEQGRSFFYVGDVKQAIYGWRGGDAGLFGRVRERWPSIVHETMAVSYRSAPAVLDLVNRVFDQLPLIDALPAPALQRWNAEFETHVAARPGLAGRAEVLQATGDEEDSHHLLLQMVRELPAGLETAILVRSNTEGKKIADTLRGDGLRVSLEGSADLRDDTAVEAVLAALKQAAHPADGFSKKFLQLVDLKISPFGLLDMIRQGGLTPAVRHLIAGLPLLPEAAFSQARLQRLLEVAIDFDRLGDPSVDRFLAYVDKTRLKENEARGVIRIMTIHQSKGLGFDAVIVPIKASGSFAKSEADQLVGSPADAADPFVTLLPVKTVCARIPEMRALYEDLEADKTYETLCTLYVALTRAKRSVQVLLPKPPKSQGSLGTVANWLADRLADDDAALASTIEGTRCLARWGDGDWAADLSTAAVTPAAPSAFVLPAGQKTLSRLEPSRESAKAEKVDQAFRYFPQDGRALGSRVHALLEQVDWVDDLEVDSFLAAQEEAPESEAAGHLRQAFAMSALKRPPNVTDLWREQRFESVLPEGWITGIFDRVVLFKDEAWIQDFKTNQKVDAATAEHYRPQMQLYRRVLADMLGFTEDRIRCQLLFTKTGEVVEV